MFQSFRVPAAYRDRRRESGRGRLRGLFLALVIEGLLVLVVLSLGSSLAPPRGSEEGLVEVRFKAAPETRSREEEQQQAKPEDPQPVARSSQAPAEREQPVPPVPEPRQDAPAPPPIQLSPQQMTTADIAPRPSAPAAPPAPGRSKMGPPAPGSSPDTPRVSGSGPNGEPLYAASWYREPYEDELRGYLSTATGPGWGLIACRTAPDFRVEDCVMIDEHPTGSNIARAVLAAAWQFRVRPPRIGGQPRIGEWVRIRIDYDLRRR